MDFIKNFFGKKENNSSPRINLLNKGASKASLIRSLASIEAVNLKLSEYASGLNSAEKRELRSQISLIKGAVKKIKLMLS